MKHFCYFAALFFGVLSIGYSVDFVKDIQPIFGSHCYDCHGAEKQKSGLRLDVRSRALKGGEYEGPNIIPGDAEASNLIHFVRGDDGEKTMPPKGEGLSVLEIKTLEQWINEGAIWPEGVDKVTLKDPSEHWSFQPLNPQAVPATKDRGFPRNAIDHYILTGLKAANLSPNPPADKRTWLRRVYLDLTGLLPMPDAVAAFLDDESEEAYEKVVDSLLASPRYGERWAQHWLDVVRYADTHGFEVNTPRPNAWPYRDYVIEAFNSDTPYDRFIREQLTGDLEGKDSATGFLVTAAALLPGQIGKDEESKRLARQDELGEIVNNVGEAFLGLSVGCARCHDHKFDPVSAKDYYAMQAFFSGVLYGDRELPNSKYEKPAIKLARMEAELAKQLPSAMSGVERGQVNVVLNVECFEPVVAKKVRFTVLETMAENRREACIDEFEIFDTAGRNVALASSGVKVSASGSRTQPGRHELPFINDGVYGNSRSWMSDKVGTGWVEFEFAESQKIDRIFWGRDREGKFGDRLAVNYKIEVSNDSGGWKRVADSTDRQPFQQKHIKRHAFHKEAFPAAVRPSATKLSAERDAFVKLHPGGKQMVFAGRFTSPEPMYLLRRGDPEQPGEEVAPAVPEFFGSVSLPREAGDQDRRRTLAQWISSPENPLTARVMANRIWQWHFGIGLVETANDFGLSGMEPSHPELLDWLAAELIQSGWSLKHLHRLIVLSATYRQSSQYRSDGMAVDSGSRLLWRYPSRRIEAEPIRDSMLLVSGSLNLETGGPGFDLFQKRGGLSGFPPVEVFKKSGFRRMIYAHKIRMERDAVFGAFDCPDAGQSAPLRRQSTTPIQALNLFNSQFTIDQSESFAKHIISIAGDEVAEQVNYAWQLSFSRSPDPDERDDAISLVLSHGLATLCRAIYNSNEFVFLP